MENKHNNEPPYCKWPTCKEFRNEGSEYCTLHGEQTIENKKEELLTLNKEDNV